MDDIETNKNVSRKHPLEYSTNNNNNSNNNINNNNNDNGINPDELRDIKRLKVDTKQIQQHQSNIEPVNSSIKLNSPLSPTLSPHAPNNFSTTSIPQTNQTVKKNKTIHRLFDLSLEALIKNIDQISTLGNDYPDDLCQTLISLFRSKKLLSLRTLRLFENCKLTKLDLYGKDISINDDWLDITQGIMSSTLVSVNVSKNNSLTDQGIRKLVQLGNLNHLDISYCERLTGSGLEELLNSDLPIQKLSLEGCSSINIERLLKQIPSKLPALDSLNLSACKLTDSDCELLSQIKTLSKLDISRNPEITDSGIGFIAKSLLSLVELDLSRSGQKLTELAFQYLINSGSPSNNNNNNNNLCKSLKSLLAEDCHINDSAMLPISKLTSLTTLVLINNPFTDLGVSYIGSLTSLTSLDMSMCTNITDDAMHSLKNLTQLSKLNLNFCSNLSDQGVSSLTDGLSQLKSLGIIGCNRFFIKVRHRPLVLLVEDNPFQVKIITKVMERYNFDVEIASNGQMALDMFRRNPRYELIVMDIIMPIMDGLTATMLIREYEREKGLRRTPVIIQTADSGESHRLVCLAAGCDDFMTKPLDSRIVDRARKLLKSDSNNTNNINNNNNNNNTNIQQKQQNIERNNSITSTLI